MSGPTVAVLAALASVLLTFAVARVLRWCARHDETGEPLEETR